MSLKDAFARRHLTRDCRQSAGEVFLDLPAAQREGPATSIWVYSNAAIETRKRVHRCPYCLESLDQLQPQTVIRRPHDPEYDNNVIQISICGLCGWWHALDIESGTRWRRHCTQNVSAASASLKQLDLTDISLPIELVRSYLCAKYVDRFDVHPRLFEQVVASVFGDFGYSAEVTAYSGDFGIDVILRKGDEQIGVQVKRYKNTIGVDQVRELLGALVLGGLTRGMFVTTSGYQRGVPGTAERSSTCGYPIELFDADRFFDALKIAQRSMYRSKEDFHVDHQQMQFTEIPIDPDDYLP